MVSFRTAFDRLRVVKDFLKPSLTKQAHKNECDINRILAKYDKKKTMDYLSTIPLPSGDASNVPDLRTALALVNRANSMFDALPSKIRSRFENDPVRFYDFCNDPKNLDEMVSLGFVKKPDVKTVVSEPSTLGST